MLTMWSARFMLLALASLAFFPVNVWAQADPFLPKPVRDTSLKVGDRVVIPAGSEPRASKNADDAQLPAPGDQRNAFRVYRIEILEPEWVWIQADHDGTAGWIVRQGNATRKGI